MPIFLENEMHVDVKQGSQEWFDIRKGRITASIAGALLGYDPNITESQAMKIVMDCYDKKENIVLDHGKHFEKEALEDFKIQYGMDVKECGIFTEDEWLAGSPDGLIGEFSILEIKCPFRDKELAGIFSKRHYHVQCQINMYLTGRELTYFYQWLPDGRTMMEEVRYDEDYAIYLISELYEIYQELHSTKEKQRAGYLMSKYQDTCDQIKKLEEEKKETLAELVTECKERESIINGKRLFLMRRKGSVNYKELIDDLDLDIDIDAYRSEDSVYWTVK